ncbi:MAG: MTH1187 family thiamine-binding protein [Chloroflexota bacterium]|nr:MTH1187 family thiamine-binding protein [Chloroflexota bacterium]
MAVAEVSIVPIGTGSPSVSKYVARVVQVLQNQEEIKYEFTPMGTILEGDVHGIFDLVQRMHRSAFDGEVLRVATTLKIDDRLDKDQSMNGKLSSLQRELE